MKTISDTLFYTDNQRFDNCASIRMMGI